MARKRWNDGLPIELETLALMLVTTSKHMNTKTNFINSYCNNDHEWIKKVRIFVRRALDRNGLTVRKKTRESVDTKKLERDCFNKQS